MTSANLEPHFAALESAELSPEDLERLKKLLDARRKVKKALTGPEPRAEDFPISFTANVRLGEFPRPDDKGRKRYCLVSPYTLGSSILYIQGIVHLPPQGSLRGLFEITPQGRKPIELKDLSQVKLFFCDEPQKEYELEYNVGGQTYTRGFVIQLMGAAQLKKAGKCVSPPFIHLESQSEAGAVIAVHLDREPDYAERTEELEYSVNGTGGPWQEVKRSRRDETIIKITVPLGSVVCCWAVARGRQSKISNVVHVKLKPDDPEKLPYPPPKIRYFFTDPDHYADHPLDQELLIPQGASSIKCRADFFDPQKEMADDPLHAQSLCIRRAGTLEWAPVERCYRMRNNTGADEAVFDFSLEQGDWELSVAYRGPKGLLYGQPVRIKAAKEQPWHLECDPSQPDWNAIAEQLVGRLSPVTKIILKEFPFLARDIVDSDFFDFKKAIADLTESPPVVIDRVIQVVQNHLLKLVADALFRQENSRYWKVRKNRLSSFPLFGFERVHEVLEAFIREVNRLFLSSADTEYFLPRPYTVPIGCKFEERITYESGYSVALDDRNCLISWPKEFGVKRRGSDSPPEILKSPWVLVDPIEYR